MKIYLNLLLWTTHVSEEQFTLFKTISDMGYDGVEVPLFEGSKEHYTSMSKAIKDADLSCTTVTCAGPDSNAVSNDPSTQKAAEDYLKWAVDISEILESQLLVGPFFAAHGDFSFDEPISVLRERSAKVIKNVAQYANTKDISLSLEFLNRFETFLLNCTSDTADFLKLIDESNVGILYDTHHANIEEKSITQAFEAHGSDFNHIHLSESHRGNLGEGQVNWEETKSALKKLTYSGNVAVEAFAHDVEGFSKVAHVWREIFSSKQDLAVKSLAFAKQFIK